MKILYVLVMLSGGPGPTWTISTPVTVGECIAMKEAIESFDNGDDSIFGGNMPMPQFMECKKVMVRGE